MAVRPPLDRRAPAAFARTDAIARPANPQIAKRKEI